MEGFANVFAKITRKENRNFGRKIMVLDTLHLPKFN